ncbi:MAG: xylose isomerase [Phycisphaerae bacterium]|nr:xylose isomerase [Phycisphaerae bacterium]MAT82117.1 xylose isomerase [Phycisphaerae bacterium]|tara:strand:+ start:29 stop:1342 length:1314 start_codon:yes stop_codon:yes gene_type:complete
MSEYFPDVPSIAYAGADSRDPLTFRHYDPDAIIEGQTMRSHLRFAAAFWHTMRNDLSDPFGSGTAIMPWDDGSQSLENAERRIEAFFEFLDKIDIDFYCFHDRDVAPEGSTVSESRANLEHMASVLERHQASSGRKLLWGTACLFSHPRYVHGAGTSCSVDVFAHAAAQVRSAIDVTHRLGGGGYVFWGGREGYSSLINTDMARERQQLARLLEMAVEYKHQIGFKGTFYIEPKPMEPTTHQYDFDVAACLDFLREFGLLDEFMLNIETNHATLASHSMDHELSAAAAAGVLGSIDANMGHEHLGWDTDHFPTDIYLTARIMRIVLAMGGIGDGGLNFDAKRRRGSFEPVDLFHAHIAGMDAFARGLKIAAAIRADRRLDEAIQARYASWDDGLGQDIMNGSCTLERLEAHAASIGEPSMTSGREEMLDAIFNDFIR